MADVVDTQDSSVAMNVLVMNLQKLLELLFVLFARWLQLLLVDGEARMQQFGPLGV
jgi:hypothetical protein